MTNRLVFVLHRRPEMSRDEFQAYWSATHAPLVKSVADVLGITGYHQVHTLHEIPTYAARAFDGVAELWFDPVRATGSPDEQQRAGALLLEDEARFIDLPASPIVYGEEHTMLDDACGDVRMTAVTYRKAGTTRDEFRRRWAEVHAPLALAHPDVIGLTRYVQVHTPDDAETWPPATARRAPAPFDGLAEAYFAKVDVDPEIARPIRAALAEDTEQLTDSSRSVATLGRVDVIIERR